MLLLGTLRYARRCRVCKTMGRKEKLYVQHGIVEDVNLIVSKDDLNGGIDSAAISVLIKST